MTGALGSVLVLALLAAGHPGAGATVPPAAVPTAEPGITNNTFEDRVLRQINKRRAARDLPKVRIVSKCLERYAEDWAETIAQTGLLVHRDQSIIVTDCELRWAGETLARGSSLTPASTVKAWMKSSGHRAVIMKRRADRAGIGVRKDAEDRTVVVLNFGDK